MRGLLLISALQIAQCASVTMANYDLARTNANTAETTLTQASFTNFGKLGSWTTDARVYHQPLFVDGSPPRLFVCTANNTCYAFNAQSPGSAALWSVHFGAPTSGPSPTPSLGCIATPYIDSDAGILYETCYVSGWKLYAINIADGSTAIAAVSVSANCNDTFDGSLHVSRAAIHKNYGSVFVALAGWGDITGFRGRVISYDATTLNQSALWCAAQSGTMGGIWMAGSGIADDGAGHLYFSTGDGDWNGTDNFSDSVLKLNSDLTLSDYFTPSDYASMQSTDGDFSAGRVLLLGSQLFATRKAGKGWLLNQSALGHLEGGGGASIPQSFTLSGGLVFGGMAFANNGLFVSGSGNQTVRRFAFNGSTFNTTPTQAAETSGFPGYSLVYTSNGTTAGTDILWGWKSMGSGTQNSVLSAWKATTMELLWTSTTAASGATMAFGQHIVVNGQVFVQTLTGIAVYGPLPTSSIRGKMTSRGGSVER